MFTGCRHGAGNAAFAGIIRWTRKRCAAWSAMQILTRGINFLVPCGTTGESPTLTRKEHLRVVEIDNRGSQTRRKTPVLAGGRRHHTTHAIEHAARECEAMGASGILSVSPYYNKPTQQEGLYQHFRA